MIFDHQKRMDNSSSEEAETNIDSIVTQLRLLAIKFERTKEKVFRLQNGTDLSDLIPKLKTEEDVINLAHRILDGTILSETGPYNDFKEEEKTYKEENEEENKDVNEGFGCMDEDEDDDERDPKREALVDLFIRNGYHNMWETWFDCFKYFGYEAPGNLKTYEMPNVYELPVVFEDAYDKETFDVPAYFKTFIEGQADASTLLTIVDAIVAYYIEEKEEMDSEELDEEERQENKYDIYGTRDMVSGAVDMLYEALANGEEDKKIPLIEDFWNEFREHEDDVDALMEIYEEVDAELDKLDDAEFDSYEQGCCEDCSVPCDVHEEDDIDDDIKPYPVLYNARGYKSREEWVVKKRKVFDEVDIPIEEIRVEQSQTDLIIDPRAFKRLTLEIVQDFREGGYHFEDGALEALQTAAEAHLIQNFEQASARAVKANRTYIGIADMKSTV